MSSLKDIRERDRHAVADLGATGEPMRRAEMDRHFLLEHIDDLEREVESLRRKDKADRTSRLLGLDVRLTVDGEVVRTQSMADVLDGRGSE